MAEKASQLEEEGLSLPCGINQKTSYDRADRVPFGF